MEKPDRGDKKYWRSQSNSLKDDKWFFKEDKYEKDVVDYLSSKQSITKENPE